MKCVNFSVGALCAVLLLATTCSKPEFDNPLDPKGNNYLYGDTSDEECKIASQGSGSGLFSNRCERHTLTTNASPPSGGNVTRTPNQTEYVFDTRVTLTATPTQGYTFAGWTDAPNSVNASSPSITFNITANTTLTANFAREGYTLATGASPATGGNVIRTPDLERYDSETQVNVTAVPAEGYVFTGWTGAPASADATNPSISFNIGSNMTLTANFDPIATVPTYTLTVNANPSAGGTVSPDGASTLRSGSSITVRAEAAQGYEFTGWTGQVPTSVNASNDIITFEMNDDIALIANFREIIVGPPPTYTISTVSAPAAGGIISRSPNLANYEAGAIVTVTATPNNGYEFAGWTGDMTSMERILSFNINSNITLTANFALITYTLTATASPTAGGSVTRSPSRASYNAGTSVTVTATVASDYMFTGWSDGVTSQSRTVTMSSNVTLVANFELIPPTTYTLTATASPTAGGSVSRTPSQTSYNEGTTVTVTAMAASGYTFTGWSDGVTSASRSVTMSSNVTLTANFEPITYTLTAIASPTAGGSVTRTPNQTSYNEGASVTVTATAASGYMFTGWSDGVTSASRTVTMSQDRSLTANFQWQPQPPGSFTDTRDGKSYRTVVMPDGKTWMAENLNYQTSSSWCYGDDPSYCDAYGRLYTWSAAMGGASSSNTTPSGVQGVCPSGWHLPSEAEWAELVNFVGSPAGTKLKSTSGWNSGGNGTDDFGFSALPGGRRGSGGGFGTAGNSGNWWSATENDAGDAWRRSMNYGSDDVGRYNWDKTDALSVRCVRDVRQ